MAGRGSFIESFPLFGYNLEDYDELFAEKLDLLLQIRSKAQVTWKGRHRPPPHVHVRALQQPLQVWIASGGKPQSVERAGALDLPLAIAIIGGAFGPLAEAVAPSSRPNDSWSGSTATAFLPTRPKPRARRSSRPTPR
jgi:alkanesulfonate monooxygenase SsuD/methylene tetrahydromethanopterin reductase-like flavin-dependent oxidoreductase (luciferase family)